MSISTLIALVKFYASQTPANAINVLRKLKPDKWIPILDGVQHKNRGVAFSLDDSFKEKALVCRVSAEGPDNSIKQLRYVTRFDNKGHDKLTIDGMEMVEVSHDFDLKPFKKDARIETFYKTGDLGVFHSVELVNKF